MVPTQRSRRSGAAGARRRGPPASAWATRGLFLVAVVIACFTRGPAFAPGSRSTRKEASLQNAPVGYLPAGTPVWVGRVNSGVQACPAIVRCAAKKKAAAKDPVCDGDTIYIKVHTGRYLGELDGTSRKEWVKARGTKKDKDHALTIEKAGGGPVESGDTIRVVMPLTVTNGTKIHMDIVGSAVRARYYDTRGEWQKMVIIKQEGGPIYDGDQIFIRSVFMNGRDYMDANPLERFADGEVKCRWPDEGEWQVLTIEK